MHSLAGSASASPTPPSGKTGAGAGLDQNPVIQHIQANIASTQATIAVHGRQIGTINATLSSAAEDSRATREMMERMMQIVAMTTPLMPTQMTVGAHERAFTMLDVGGQRQAMVQLPLEDCQR